MQDLTEEAARAVRENLTENEQTIFDLLRQGKKLKDKDWHEVKEIARELLQHLEAEKLRVDHWAEKAQTRAAVRKAINDYLFSKLPYPTYDDDDIQAKAEVLFEYFRTGYGGAAA